MSSVLSLLDDFYESTVQTIKPWTAAPPKLRPDQPEREDVEDVPDQLISTSLSSQDGAESPDIGLQPATQLPTGPTSPPEVERSPTPPGWLASRLRSGRRVTGQDPQTTPSPAVEVAVSGGWRPSPR